MVVKPIHFRKCISCDSLYTLIRLGSLLGDFGLYSCCSANVYACCTTRTGEEFDWKWQWESSLWTTLPALLWFGLYKPTQTPEHILTSQHNILLFAHSIMHNDIFTLIDIGFQCSFQWQLKSSVTVNLETTGLDDLS
jgi:hypothetical protein